MRSTERLSVNIALVGRPKAVSYDVQLNASPSSEQIWAAKLPPVVSSTGDVQLKFELPARSLHPGLYSVK